MMAFIGRIMGGGKTGYTSDFSDFMRNAKAKERKKVFLKVAHQATEDQKKLMKQASVK